MADDDVHIGHQSSPVQLDDVDDDFRSISATNSSLCPGTRYEEKGLLPRELKTGTRNDNLTDGSEWRDEWEGALVTSE
jgi:hypothetical protein